LSQNRIGDQEINDANAQINSSSTTIHLKTYINNVSLHPSQMPRFKFHRFPIPITFRSCDFIRTMSSQAQFTKSLPTREPSADESKIIQDILSLYQCKPSENAYSHYAETAQFRDSVSIAKGKSQIQAQFNGMPKLFSSSETQGAITQERASHDRNESTVE
jgi:hypothetical protein